MDIKCVVACRNADGASDFYFCVVRCKQAQYDVGDHYNMAENQAWDEGYEGPMVVFDENDGPNFLFDHFVWESATTVS